MPTNIKELEMHAKAAWEGFVADTGYVRGGKFIRHFQEHALSELQERGLPPKTTRNMKFALSENGVVLGAFFPKELDVFVQGDASGPLLGISFKCMMSGIGKNVNNRWEELVGDASNLHSRFPMLALGYVMVLPAVTKPDGKGNVERVVEADGSPTTLGKQIAAKLLGIRGRRSAGESPTTYEEVALVVLDFEGAESPRAVATFPEPDSTLRIERFYDALVERFRERNHSLE